jgi:anaerobic magnesium-protoporphyrin IX monomethyl ester cyclase
VARELLEAFPLIDIVAIGEGEGTAVDIATAIRDKKALDTIKGIGFHSARQIVLTGPRERQKDLDRIPLPAYHLIDLKKYNNGGISISRGCPYGCTFCNLVGMWQRKVYARSNDLVLKEIKYLRSNGKKIVSFVDDTFITNRSRTKALCQQLLKEGVDIHYVCQGRVDSIDQEMLALLKRSGCREIFFGVESGSNQVLKKIKKQFTIETALKSIERTLQKGIAVTASFMWGFPFETKADFLQTLQAVRKAKKMGARIAFSILTPLPLSPLYNEYKDHLVLPENGPTFVSGMLGQDWQEDADVRALVKQYPQIFPSFYYYDSPALREKIQLIELSTAKYGLHYVPQL